MIHGAPKGASIFLPFCGFFVMSKIVDDMADKVCYASTMKIGPEEIRESRSLGGLIPPGLFLCPEGGG